MFERVISMVGPDIWTVIKAIILLVVAFVVAAIVKGLVRKILVKTPLRKVFENAPDKGDKMILFISKLFQVIVFLLFVPGIFGILGVDAATDPINQFMTAVWTFFPNIIAAVIILWIGFFIAGVVKDLLDSLLGRIKLDKIQEIAGAEIVEKGRLSRIISCVVYIFLDVFFVIQAIDVLKLSALSAIGNAIMGFIPYVLAASLILLGCYILETVVTKFLKKRDHIGMAFLFKIMIYIVGIFMILSELNIAPMIVNLAFIIIIAGISIAFAIAFGVGGREFAERMLKRLEEKLVK